MVPRAYRDGDELRRVHWRSTARYGELMVRREEQRWRNRAVLFLDTRLGGHGGRGPASSFEYAVSAAASIGVHLAREEMDTEFVTDAGPVTAPGSFEDVLLDTLAVIRPSRNSSLGAGLAQLPADTSGLFIVVAGHLSAGEARHLATARRASGPAMALLLAVSTWAAERPGSRGGRGNRRGIEGSHRGRLAGGHGDRRHAAQRGLGHAQPQPHGPRPLGGRPGRRATGPGGSRRGRRNRSPGGEHRHPARRSRSEPMNTRLTVAAAVATVLASIALYPLLAGGTWFWGGVGAVIVVAAVGAATRRRAIPAILCFLAALGAEFLYLNAVFASRQSWAGLVPTGASMHHLQAAAPPGHGRDVQGCATGPAQARDRAAHRGRDRPGRHPDRRARGAPAPAGHRRAARSWCSSACR